MVKVSKLLFRSAYFYLGAFLLVTALILNTSLPSVFAADITTGLFGYWNADESTGTLLNDVSGSGFNGTLMNGTTWSEGKVGGALHFDGVNDYVNLGNFNPTGNALTVAAWVKVDRFNNISTFDGRFISKSIGVDGSQTYFHLSGVKANANTKPRFMLKLKNTTQNLISPTLLPLNTWFHLAGVYNGTHMIMYKDGQEIARAAKTGNIAQNSNAPVWIGGDPGGATLRPFAGSIDDVRIYSRALTQAEIQDLVNFAPTNNQQPVASFTTNPTSGEAPITVSFDGSSTTDSDGTIATYIWDFGDGTNGNGINVSHQYSNAGTYAVTLTATDNVGAVDTETHNVTVTQPAPTPTPVPTDSPTPSPSSSPEPSSSPSSSTFTIAVLPDTQGYSRYYPSHFTAQTQWIADNKVAQNIVYMIHEGDIVDQQSEAIQWQRANTSISILDGVIPYTLTVGNHDFSVNNTRSYANYNTYFPVSRYQNEPHFGGVYQAGTLANSYYTFSAGGMNFLVITLEFGPRDAVLAWANTVADNHPNHKVIMVTHDYLYYDNTLHGSDPSHLYGPEYWNLTGNNGVGIWDKFVKNPRNMFMVLSGHVHLPNDGAGNLVSTGVNGNKVYQMMANYQDFPEGGRGYLRLLKIDPVQKTIDVKTYSPVLNQYMTDSDNQFTLTNVDVGEQDTTPPSVPTNVSAGSITENSLNLTWTAASDPENGISLYRVYRNGQLIASPSSESHSETGLVEATGYTYQVSAVNNVGLESALSEALVVTTFADQNPAQIVNVRAVNGTTVTVEFSEALNRQNAETVSYYSLDNAASVLSATLGGDNKTVTLSTSPLASTTYLLNVSGVTDLAQTPNVTSTTATFNYVSIPTTGLISHWSLNETSGTLANDESPSNNDGTLYSGPTWGIGKVLGGLTFDGVDSYVRINDSASLNIQNTSVSMSFFMKHTGTSTTYAGIVGEQSGSWYAYGMDKPATPRVLLRNSTSARSYEGGFTVEPNVWTHIAFTVEDNGTTSTIRTYKNGVLQRTTTGAIRIFSGTSPFYLGKRDVNYLSGMLDEVRVYNRVLTDEEVAQLSAQ